MLTRDNMKFFIDPLSDPFMDSDKVFVTEERVLRNIYLHKIVEIDKSGYRHGGRMWSVTKGSRDHVMGPAVNAEGLDYNSHVIGWRNGRDEEWGVGRFLGTRNNRALVTQFHRADQRTYVGVPGDGPAYEHLDTWFPAADWALTLMPDPKDSAALVASKLALAEQRWNQRKAKVTLMVESMARNYTQLDELIEDGSMPMPKFGAVFVGSVMIPAGRAPGRAERTVAVQEQIDALAAGLGGATPEPNAMLMSMRVETPLPVKVQGRTGLETIKPGMVRDTLQNKLNNYDLRVSDYQLTPILRGAVSSADATL